MNTKETAGVVIDVQGDFTEAQKGSLPVPGTNQDFIDAIRRATAELKQNGFAVFATQDWHPQTHISFCTSHEGKKAFERVRIGGRERVLWPPHCVQGTEGARLLLSTAVFEEVVKKGDDEDCDSYSGFKDEMGKETPLHRLLRDRRITNLIIYGIATDYCVLATVMDAVGLGYAVVVIKDLTRGVDPETTRSALERIHERGVLVLDTFDVQEIQRLSLER